MRVLVASRTPDLAMILGVAGYDVTDGRPGDARDWIEHAELPDADVLVIDVPDANSNDRLIRLAAEGTSPLPVVTTSDAAEWSGIDSVHIVARPLSRETLIAAIEALAPSPALPETTAAEPEPVDSGALSEEPPLIPATQQRGALSLVDLRDELTDEMTVTEVATEVCALVTESGRAEAAALLIADDGRWRVSGGSGLRQLEHRIELDRGHWLVKEMLSSTRGAVIDRSDVARAHMRNAPVSSREQLAFVTNQSLEAVLVVGRDEDAFDADDLSYLVQVLHEAEPPLRRALDLRALARGLSRFRDET